MILQALTEYYQRKKDAGEIAPVGWEQKPIPFIVLIDRNGKFIKFKDTREFIGKKAKPKIFLVPSLGEQKGSGIKANFFWENIEYFFGIPVKDKKDNKYISRVREQHEEFINKIKSIEESCNKNMAYKAVVEFLKSKDKSFVKGDELWKDVFESNSNLLFEVEGFGIITDIEEIKHSINNIENASPDGFCLVTGEFEKIARLHPPIKGVKNANSTGAGLVAVNNEISNGVNKGQTPAFASYMKQQGYNSPISEKAAFFYTASLNYLLRNDSVNDNKIYLEDLTLIFWSEKKAISHDFEENFRWFIDDSPKDDPDKGIRAVKSLYESIQSGKRVHDSKGRFYILGLSPNSARISIRFWKIGTVVEFESKIKQHFDDFTIIHKEHDAEYLSLSKILRSIVLEYKMENVPPNLAGRMVECVVDGTPYPETLLNLCVNRIRAEASKKDQNGNSVQNVTRTRAAILKAYLNRKQRYYDKNKKEVTMALDPENKDIGYLLGRLFAVLEQIQQKSAGGAGKLNSTIRDRYYGSFSSTPITVFTILMKLKNNHLKKINGGLQKWFEDKVGEIMKDIDASNIPSHLTLQEQAKFAVGYYHQRMYKS